VSAQLAVEIEAAPAERVAADLLVTPFFGDERPLRGPASRIDWRMCGLLSEWLRRGILPEAAGASTLLASHGRLRAPRVLLFGLGPRAGFDAARLRAAARASIERCFGLGAGFVALALPDETLSGVAADRGAAAAVVGIAEALSVAGAALRLRLVVTASESARAAAALGSLAQRGLVAGVPMRLMSASGEPVRGGRVRYPEGTRRDQGPRQVI
jgi:leucyl aminopeptidase